MALDAAALQHEECAALVLEDVALLGEDADALLRVALIVDQDAEQLPFGRRSRIWSVSLLFQLVKRPGWTTLADEVGANLGRPLRSSRSPHGET